jgi:acetyltransferase EpsM
MQTSYCLYGAGGHAKVIIEILEKSKKEIRCLYVDENYDWDIFEYKISGKSDIFEDRSLNWIVAIGNNSVRRKITESHFLTYGIAIDPDANVSKRAKILEGTVIMPGVSINSSTVIGRHTIINTNSSVDHDCQLDDFVHISPNATLCGGVLIGEGTHVGAGAVVIPGINIGKWCTIGAGSVIIKDVPDFSTVVGNPGRIIKNENK